ncbi:unnamed protein product [Prorocentrum cordatum]|uniref:DhaL domain-containing protein n=1 Tax=Prorocentrum cordatum TaxID=2364126 RepID=A0ABN9V1V0_9DINO|nr:unnamed protein product [Polarella glacialis]
MVPYPMPSPSVTMLAQATGQELAAAGRPCRAVGGARKAGAAALAANPAAAAAYCAVVAALDAGIGGKGLATLVAAATRGTVQGAAAATGRALDDGADSGKGIETEVLGLLEEVLAAVSNAAGLKDKAGLGEAKESLREQGDVGKRLASRVSRPSTARSCRASRRRARGGHSRHHPWWKRERRRAGERRRQHAGL